MAAMMTMEEDAGGRAYDTIRIDQALKHQLMDLQDDLRRRVGRKPTISTIIQQALECLMASGKVVAGNREVPIDPPKPAPAASRPTQSSPTQPSPTAIYDAVMKTLAGLEQSVNEINRKLAAEREPPHSDWLQPIDPDPKD